MVSKQAKALAGSERRGIPLGESSLFSPLPLGEGENKVCPKIENACRLVQL